MNEIKVEGFMADVINVIPTLHMTPYEQILLYENLKKVFSRYEIKEKNK